MEEKKTIVVEEKLKEIFNYLKPVVSSTDDEFQPVFKEGDHKELIAFFSQSKGLTKYPLIWLDMPYEESHYNKKRAMVKNLTLILAVETNSWMLNSERMAKTFKPILYPLLDDILTVLRVANTVDASVEYKITKFPNYSDTEAGDEGKFIDVWDAIKLTLDCNFNDNCLREIKY